MTKMYYNASNRVADVANGRNVPPGEQVELPDRLDPHDRDLVDNGVLLELGWADDLDSSTVAVNSEEGGEKQ